MKDKWEELKETIMELRDNNGTGTQQEVCKFLVNLMNVLENEEGLNYSQLLYYMWRSESE